MCVQCVLHAGMHAFVLCLARCIRTQRSAESFVVTEDHEEDLEDEISVPEGAIVKVTVKKLSGWWQVR